MDTIYVEPVEGQNAYNCDNRSWIKGVTRVKATSTIKRMLKKNTLKIVSAPKADEPKTKKSKT